MILSICLSVAAMSISISLPVLFFLSCWCFMSFRNFCRIFLSNACGAARTLRHRPHEAPACTFSTPPAQLSLSPGNFNRPARIFYPRFVASLPRQAGLRDTHCRAPPAGSPFDRQSISAPSTTSSSTPDGIFDRSPEREILKSNCRNTPCDFAIRSAIMSSAPSTR